MLIVFLTYLALIAALCAFERARISTRGPDLITCFQGLAAIQTLVPAAIVTGVLSIGPMNLDLQRSFFQRVFDDLEATAAMQVLLLNALFLISTYATILFMLRGKQTSLEVQTKTYLQISLAPWCLIIAIGILSNLVLLWLLGGGWESYARLIQFRAGAPEVSRTFVTANLFSLTQSFSLIAIVGVVVFLRKKRTVLFGLSVVIAIFFAVMTASRRAFFVALILIYFVFVLEYRRVFVRQWLLPIFIVSLPIVMYGKQILGSIAFGSAPDYKDLGLSSILRAVMDVGITNVESWATLMYLDEPLRFGVDHVMSAARRIPEGMLGVNIQFPERIVRISTEAFVGRYEADLPPGLFGQMWLDWGYAGPVIWGILFGLQLAFLQRASLSIKKSHGVTAIFVILLFIVALPLNTGSFDFTFSIDMFVLIVFAALIVRRRQVDTSMGPAAIQQ